METKMLQIGQSVNTPDGEGEITELMGEKVTVKLKNNNVITYPEDEVEDNSTAG